MKKVQPLKTLVCSISCMNLNMPSCTVRYLSYAGWVSQYGETIGITTKKDDGIDLVAVTKPVSFTLSGIPAFVILFIHAPWPSHRNLTIIITQCQ